MENNKKEKLSQLKQSLASLHSELSTVGSTSPEAIRILNSIDDIEEQIEALKKGDDIDEKRKADARVVCNSYLKCLFDHQFNGIPNNFEKILEAVTSGAYAIAEDPSNVTEGEAQQAFLELIEEKLWL